MIAFCVAILSISLSVILEWGLSGILPFWAVPPLIGIACATVFLFVSFSIRIFIVVVLGGILDVFSFFPFGTYILTLFGLAVLAEGMEPALRLMNRSVAFPFGGGVLVVAYAVFIPVSGYVIGLAPWHTFSISIAAELASFFNKSLIFALTTKILWAAVYVIAFFIFQQLRRGQMQGTLGR